MNLSNRCPRCNTELPADAPQGLCPACLLQGGLGTQTGGSRAARRADFVPPAPGELAPHFPDLEILELVGQGGMGVVYKARQKRLDRPVALKILSPEIGQDPAFAERFAREARALAMLSHPHIVAVHDFGQTGGLYYFLMEYVDGVNLRRVLEAGKLAPQEALAIVPQICDALEYAHDHGVVHRDIKPENVLLDKEGRVKIADFGIAKLVGPETAGIGSHEDENASVIAGALDAPYESLTEAGQVVGTPEYMAPEQFEHPLEVDHRADIYSLGVVFYQMLTGELPVGRFAPPSRKVRIDVRLDEVVLRALEKEPERRYQHAGEIKTEVETIITSPNSAGVGWPSGVPTRTDQVIAAVRWTARALGLLAFVFFAVLFIGERREAMPAMQFGNASAGERIESIGMSLMALGLVIGWQWEGLGAIAILVGAMQFHIVEGRFYMGPLDVPLVAGLFYGLCWWMERRWPRSREGSPRGNFGGPMVRTYGGRGRIYWPAVIQTAVMLIGISAAVQLPLAVFLGGKYHPIHFAALVLAGWALLAVSVYRGLRVRPGQSAPPPGPSLLAAEQASRRRDWRWWVMAVGARQGKKVIHWPVLILQWPLVFALFCGIWMLNQGRGPDLALLLAFAGMSAFLVVFWAWVQSSRSVGQLPSLDAPPPQRPEISHIAGVTATVRQRATGITALVVCLAGVPAVFLLAAAVGRNWSVWTVLGLVVSVVIVGLVCGILGWRSGAGKAAVVISALFLLAALVFLSVVLVFEAARIREDFGGWPSIVDLRPTTETASGPTAVDVTELLRGLGVARGPQGANNGGEAGKADVPWGEWNAGWSVRLRAAKTTWNLDELPEFTVDLRKRDKGEPDVARQSLHNWLLEVDGQRFRLGIFTTSWEHKQVFELGTTRVGFLAFRFERGEAGLHLRTVKDGKWINSFKLDPVGKDGQVLAHPKREEQFQWVPGTHLVRIAFPITLAPPKESEEYLAFSNPVEVQVRREGPEFQGRVRP